MAQSSDPVRAIQNEIRQHADPAKAKVLSGFFKTGRGQYGEGDRFLGVMVPVQRQIAGKYPDLGLDEIERLLKSVFHEERLVALFILVNRFGKAGEAEKKKIYNFYMTNRDRINNWDFVDLTAPKIVGPWLEHKDRGILVKLAKSRNLWDRRIAILATFHYICKGEHEETFRIAEFLLNDEHDLLHKAVGWMLREVGKRCGEDVEEAFLMKHGGVMPRTMLRYAVERFSPEKKKFYLSLRSRRPGN